MTRHKDSEYMLVYLNDISEGTPEACLQKLLFSMNDPLGGANSLLVLRGWLERTKKIVDFVSNPGCDNSKNEL